MEKSAHVSKGYKKCHDILGICSTWHLMADGTSSPHQKGEKQVRRGDAVCSGAAKESHRRATCVAYKLAFTSQGDIKEDEV